MARTNRTSISSKLILCKGPVSVMLPLVTCPKGDRAVFGETVAECMVMSVEWLSHWWHSNATGLSVAAKLHEGAMYADSGLGEDWGSVPFDFFLKFILLINFDIRSDALTSGAKLVLATTSGSNVLGLGLQRQRRAQGRLFRHSPARY